MKNTKENAEEFLLKFGNDKRFVDRLEGIPCFVELLTEYADNIENEFIPNDAYSLEVFSIKKKEAFIGYKIKNGNFHFIGVPYTEPIKIGTFKKLVNRIKKILK